MQDIIEIKKLIQEIKNILGVNKNAKYDVWSKLQYDESAIKTER